MAKQRRFCVELVRKVFQLKLLENKSNRFIGKSLGISKSTVGTYLARIAKANITTITELNSVSDEELKKIIFPIHDNNSTVKLDFEYIHKELKRKNVTLMLLWEEARDKTSDFYSYNHYCLLYRQWRKDQKISMKQVHKAGEKAFIDYAGTTIPIADSKTGKVYQAQIFLMALGASNYAYIEATWTQGTKDFLSSHVNAFKFFGGVPEVLVPDNLKSAINIASRYEPEMNVSYRQLADHYGAVIVPARAYRPKDKAKVESEVLHTSRWILARLRDRTFFSLDELNEALWELLDQYNEKKLQGLSDSRKSLFEEVEKKHCMLFQKKDLNWPSGKKLKRTLITILF